MDFERFRPRLRALVSILLNPKLRGVIDESGVVQQTLMDAHRCREQCRGTTEAEQYAWVRRMLENDLKDEIKKVGRRPGFERAIDDTNTRIDVWCDGSERSPGSQAAWVEEIERLAEAVSRLPGDQRTAVELHTLSEYSLKETADRMGRTPGAVASLVFRGMKSLRESLGGNGHP